MLQNERRIFFFRQRQNLSWCGLWHIVILAFRNSVTCGSRKAWEKSMGYPSRRKKPRWRTTRENSGGTQ
eukprot:scaffold150892_cov24-Attheya_sp.AAC.1